ncbi:MAG TPA: ankyrin repeat domain-containing protein [Bryobacteraceae bacterium]|nr:ankyrin repeat domain-containing protein [Bryobacteraceae bacterium]
MPNPIELIKAAVSAGDAARLSALLQQNPGLKARINDPVFAFFSPAIVAFTGRASRQIIDALLDAGADINARSQWWAGSFGVLDSAEPELAAYLIERGARLDVHSAARLGMFEKLKEMVAADPTLVHARGGDGQMPLHFAASVEIAEYLLDKGADIDARDIDHESTAAQYMVRERADVARYLIQRGCHTDILMAAALGDAVLVRKHLEADPESIRMRVDEHFFPKQNPRSGGSIYIWTLGKFKTAHQLAREFGHKNVLELLMERSESTPAVRLINACWLGDEATVKGLRANLSADDRHQITDAAEMNNTDAVRLMLDAGWPVDGGHGTTPLHFAAWHGNAEMARVILRHRPPLEKKDPQYQATPLGWAIHGSEHGWNRKTGDYGAVVELLLAAGAQPPQVIEGSEAVRAVLSATRYPPA